MTTSRVTSTFSLICLVYNVITCLLSQDQQVACFGNASQRLAPGGRFVIEIFVPDLQRLPPGETACPFHIGEQHVGIGTYDLVNQRLPSRHDTVARSTAQGR